MHKKKALPKVWKIKSYNEWNEDRDSVYYD